ncbi:hypothetical protein [Microbacterium sp. R86528]|uniref:hypothetical protein n=1 Tax=Microbacterium sp. R86528 TaxID=3093864 RepID=UPI0037CC90BC
MTHAPGEDVADASIATDDGSVEPVMNKALLRWWRRRPDVFGALVALTGLLAVIAVHLGPALIGVKSFSAMDRLASVAPWWDGGMRPSVLNPFLGDSIDSLLPSYIQMHERLFSGEWPLWSSLGGPGTELLASTNSPALTLSTIWFLVLPTVYAPGFVKLVEIALAMGGMYLWMRRIGMGRAAGVVAGIFYCGSGFFVGWATWSAQSSVAAMMPALFWAIERYVRRRTLRSSLPIAGVVGLLMLSGFPAAAGHALYAGGIYFIVRIVAERARHSVSGSLRTFAIGVAAVALGIALAAVQLIPFAIGLSDVDLSVRSGQFFSQQPIRSFLSVFYPETFFEVGFGGGTNPIEAYAFLGIGAVFFALVALLSPRMVGQARGVVPFLAVGTALAAAVVWQQGWWTLWLADLPIFSGNNSGRLRDLVMLFGSALAGIGVERVFRQSARPRTRILVIAAASTALLGALTIWVWQRIPEVTAEHLFWDAAPGFGIIVLAVVAVLASSRAALRAGAFAGVVVLAALQMSSSVSNYWPLTDAEDFYPQLQLISELESATEGERLATSGSFMGSTASAYGLRSATAHTFQPTTWREYLVALDLGAFGEGQSPTNPSLTFPGVETAEQRALLDRLSVAAWTTPAGAETPGKLVDASGQPHSEVISDNTIVSEAGQPLVRDVASASLRAVTFSVAEQALGNEDGVSVQISLRNAAGEVVATSALQRQLLNPGPVLVPIAAEELAPSADGFTVEIHTNVDVVLVADTGGEPALAITEPTDDGLLLSFADASGTVWERQNALPRVRWASSSEVVTDSSDRLARLQEPGLASDTVVLSEQGPTAEGQNATVEVITDSGDEVAVEVVAEGGGYLVVADWMHRGWSVSIDGDEADVVEADHAMSATFVPAGTHTVSFVYQGDGLVAGAAVSATAFVAAGSILVASLYWKRRDGTFER